MHKVSFFFQHRITIFSIFPLLLLASSLTLRSETATNASKNQSPTTLQNADDQTKLAASYLKGEGVTQSYEQAGFWYRKAAEQGNAKAMYNLGLLFMKGMGTQKDDKEAYQWINKSAQKGFAPAEYLSGLMLIHGNGVTRDTSEGILRITKAADAGNTDALAKLGQDYYFGDDGLQKDLDKAIPRIRKAAEQGNDWACRTMGILYWHGTGVPKDTEKAQEWFSLDKEHNH